MSSLSDSTHSSLNLTRRTLIGGLGAIGALGSLSWVHAAPSATAWGAGVRQGLGAEAIYPWVITMYETVKSEGISPPRAARIFAYTTQAMYEAGAVQLGADSLAGRSPIFPDRTEPHTSVDWLVSMAQAGATVMGQLFASFDGENHPLLIAQIHMMRERGVSESKIQDSRAHGRIIASLALRRAHQDEAEWLPEDYRPPRGEGMWVPTPPQYAPALEPYWGRVKTLALSNGGEVKPIPPARYSTSRHSEFYRQVMAVYDASHDLTQRQRETAHYWADNPSETGTPGGHWMMIAAKCCSDQGYGPLETLRTIMLLGTSLHDAFVSCWTAKYANNTVRPVTYIREHIDSDWMPIVGTPPFPEYTSGHSVSSGAAARTLQRVMGDFRFHDTCHEGTSKGTRWFDTFAEAADDAANSRLYGGIHYPMANINGLRQGERVGDLVLDRMGF